MEPIGADSTWINDATRASSLNSVTTDGLDVIVIGGGITGAGVALDAASRGLSVALLESRDLASGTSGYSSKLAHGGLRYLAKLDFAVAWESAVERRWLMTEIAPHLTRPLGFLVPFTSDGSRLGSGSVRAAVAVYDILRRLSGLRSAVLPRPRVVSSETAHALVPGLRAEKLRGGLLYWDGQLEDDVRLVLAVARTAARLGAHILRDTRVTSASGTHVDAVNERTGEILRLTAGAVINATGVWAPDFEPDLPMTRSRGTHLVVRAERLGNPRMAYTVAVPGAFGRHVFVLPQGSGLAYVGLTDDEDGTSDGYGPLAAERDIDFLLEVVNTTMADPLSRDDVVGAFAGLRPLVGAKRGARSGTSDISRRHIVVDTPGKPITVVGGKLTTYRRMSEDAVDAAVGRLGLDRTSPTRRLALVGAAKPERLAATRAPERLVRKYGTEAEIVHSLARLDPSLSEPVFSGTSVTGAELLFGVLAEGASSADDLLFRRTRLGLVPADAARARQRAEEILAFAQRQLPHGQHFEGPTP
ncbi:glycerol-3-phosphate dehydrogenase/oxidase [Mycetocola sp. 2940]|uniref:glycerol-3-phosphate dehydrogenase/oxidase n=1 Tax=Mycetocola sp. 2940 TaxID=3156452 RepID=UPI003391800D